MADKLRVLFISHNHPAVRPGGAEAYAYDLYMELKKSASFEPHLLAAAARHGGFERHHEGSVFTPVGDDPNQHFVHANDYDYDWLNQTITDKTFYTKHLRSYLQALNPDVVHFQHTLFLGYDLLREVRNSCPEAVTLYTLHEFLPICHRDGQMIRTINNHELCTHATPRRCNACFPGIPSAAFLRRKRFIQAQFEQIDRFLAPSKLLLDRYIEWGIPRTRIQYEECGRVPVGPLGGDAYPESGRPRNRFAFFGQINPYKGVDVLLEAMLLVERGAADPPQERDKTASVTSALARSADCRPQLWVHGANLDDQDTTFQERFQRLLDESRGSVEMMGRYVPEEQGDLMRAVDWVVVPSIWWENAPRVIQEAFQHGRPVICSNVGGMAEKVRDGIDGLHFRVGDARSLANVMTKAASTPGLWERLAAGIAPTYSMRAHRERLEQIYLELRLAKTGEVRREHV